MAAVIEVMVVCSNATAAPASRGAKDPALTPISRLKAG